MATTLDHTIRDIELAVTEKVQYEPAYRLYFNGNNPNNSDTVYAIAQNLREMMNSSSWIQSIYLYDKQHERVITVSGSREVESFGDKEWISQILKGNMSQGWQPVREIEWDDVQKTSVQVLTVNKEMPLPFGSEGALVINIKMSSIKQSVDSMVNGKLSFLTITDQEGRVIYNAHSDKESALEGTKLNELPLERLGWTLTSGIKAGNLFGWVSVVSYVCIYCRVDGNLCNYIFRVCDSEEL